MDGGELWIALISNEPWREQCLQLYSSSLNSHFLEEVRDHYSTQCEYLMSAIGFAVGLGNIWRFPAKAYQHGGGEQILIYYLSKSIIIIKPHLDSSMFFHCRRLLDPLFLLHFLLRHSIILFGNGCCSVRTERTDGSLSQIYARCTG